MIQWAAISTNRLRLNWQVIWNIYPARHTKIVYRARLNRNFHKISLINTSIWMEKMLLPTSHIKYPCNEMYTLTTFTKSTNTIRNDNVGSTSDRKLIACFLIHTHKSHTFSFVYILAFFFQFDCNIFTRILSPSFFFGVTSFVALSPNRIYALLGL